MSWEDMDYKYREAQFDKEASERALREGITETEARDRIRAEQQREWDKRHAKDWEGHIRAMKFATEHIDLFSEDLQPWLKGLAAAIKNTAKPDSPKPPNWEHWNPRHHSEY